MAERAEYLRINENLMVDDLFKILRMKLNKSILDLHMNILGN